MTREPPNARHRRVLMLGSVLSVARIPGLRAPLRAPATTGVRRVTNAEFYGPAPKKYDKPLEIIKCPPSPAT